MTSNIPYILLDDQITQSVRYYENPVAILKAVTPDEIDPVFEKLSAYHKSGHYLAGYCSYELGYALEPKLSPLMPKQQDTPLILFGVFKKPSTDMPISMRYTSERPELALTPNWSETDYLKRFETVIRYIQAGDIYQANLTFPVTGTYDGQANVLYAALRQRQPGHYGGIIKLSGPEIITFSPELFFKKTGTAISMRPMKGTRPRSADLVQDSLLITDMQAEPKSRAENLMIVDLLRNDLSRISIPGSVTVPELFSVETYPTLHQMISKIESRVHPNTSFRDIFKSLFPCGSVTGAPKIRAMEIIRELEETPRGAYCGTAGYIDPDGSACFNVGIRTLTLDAGRVSYGIGSGVVLDSTGTDEYHECLLKAQILTPPVSVLIETFLWTPEHGFKNLDRHMARLKSSARNLKYPFKVGNIRRALDRAVRPKTTPQRIRLTLNPVGTVRVTCSVFSTFKTPLKLALSKYTLADNVQITEHKLSSRDFYDGERIRLKALCGADEVIFLNAEGYLCEGSFTSIFIKREDTLFTPPRACGLLPGILRADLIRTGQAQEKLFRPKDIRVTDEIFIGNSMRGLMPATLFDLTPL